jgi:hypothetical protein
VLALAIPIYYGEQADDRAKEEIQIGRQQLRQEQSARRKTTGDLTDQDMRRVAEIVRQQMNIRKPKIKARPGPPRKQRTAKRKNRKRQ